MKKNKLKLDDLFRLYISILAGWTALSFLIPDGFKILHLIFLITLISLIIIFLTIFFNIIDENAKNIPNMLFKLSTLPLLVIVSSFAFLISEKIFCGMGAWLLLYTIIFGGLATSFLLYIIGWFIENVL